MAYAQIVSGQSEVVVCGGQESMSQAHHTTFCRNAKYGNFELKDSILCDGLTDAFIKKHMGETGRQYSRLTI